VTGAEQKQPRAKLASDKYEQLRLKVLRRDGWKCQNCGSAKDLQVHHQTFRSQLGNDCDANLITLCVTCHLIEHGSVRSGG